MKSGEMMQQTKIPERQLVQMRQDGLTVSRASRFVDPRAVHACLTVIQRRGGVWARSVLGRDLARRSLTDARWPYLLAGEEHVIVAADVEEDRLAAALLDPDNG